MSRSVELRGAAQSELNRGHTEQALAGVRFLEARDGNLSVVEVDVPESWNVGEPLTRALFLMRIQAVFREERRSAGRVVHGLRIVEFDGAPIRTSRRLELQAELLTLLGRAFSPDVEQGVDPET
jgi:hypothetical protein